MKVAVFGLWHLGCVTAGCLAKVGRQVVGLDLDERVVESLRRDMPPLHEPGLSELIADGRRCGALTFTSDPAAALADAEVLWVAFDTPVNDRDEADVAFVRDQLERIVDSIRPGTLILVSSQVPVGFTRQLAEAWRGRGFRFAYSPENLRLGKAIDVFLNPERVIVGLDDAADRDVIGKLLEGVSDRIEWMTIESAEMTKHAVNAFLATSVTFINELARLCEVVGADAKQVERGLKTEGRIGPKAYLAPGAAFAGGTLARDVTFLNQFGARHGVETPFFAGVLASNAEHKNWLRHTCGRLLAGRSQPTVCVLGLTYKPGTDTLRRSSSVELCKWLASQGAVVRAHDPAVAELPPELRSTITLCRDVAAALDGAELAVVATEWPEYRTLTADQFATAMRRPQVIDQSRFLSATLADDRRIDYVAVGRAATVEDEHVAHAPAKPNWMSRRRDMAY